MLVRHYLKLVGKDPKPLTATKEQGTIFLQGKMKQRDDFFLNNRLEIDQQIAAADQIKPGKRRIAEQVVGRKHHQLAKFTGNTVEVSPLLFKISLQAFLADVCQALLLIKTLRRRIQRRFMDIGGKDGNFTLEIDIFGVFSQKDRQGICFFSRGAGCGPGPQIFTPVQIGKQLRDNLLLQIAEALTVPEKLGHSNQKILVERFEFFLVAGNY